VEYTRVLGHKQSLVRSLRELNDAAAAMHGAGTLGYSEAFRDRCEPLLSLVARQGCWEAFCGTGRGKTSAGFG
jgi:hypothetical protein